MHDVNLDFTWGASETANDMFGQISLPPLEHCVRQKQLNFVVYKAKDLPMTLSVTQLLYVTSTRFLEELEYG